MRLPKNRQPQKNKESSQKGLALSGSRAVAALVALPALPAGGRCTSAPARLRARVSGVAPLSVLVGPEVEGPRPFIQRSTERTPDPRQEPKNI